MLLVVRNLFYGASILSGMATVYTSLGTLNGRLPGGFTPHNLPWALSVAILAASAACGTVVKVMLLLRRRQQRPLRMHPSGERWVPIDDPPE